MVCAYANWLAHKESLGRRPGKEAWEGGLGRRSGKEAWEGGLGRRPRKEVISSVIICS